MPDELNPLEAERRAKLARIREMGLDPFGGRVDNLTSIAEARGREKADSVPDAGLPGPKVAGRLIFIRDMGKLWFVRLRDETGELQIALDARRLDEPTLALRKQLDLGDLIVVQGPLGTTKTGETTIWASELQIASKSLAVPPEKWSGLTDVEARYRQRYVDLAYNESTMRQMKLRIRIVDEIRAFLRNKGFDEVETPMLQPIHGGAAARPFITHHNALDMKLFMRIAPELYLKRLLVGGFRKVFEINRNFRNEGVSPRHNPEFTMLEAYWAFANWEQMADLVEEMITHVAQTVIGTLTIETRLAGELARRPEDESTNDPMKHANVPFVPATEPTVESAPTKTITLTRPWRRATMAQLVEEQTGWAFDKHSIANHPHALAKALTAYDADGVNAQSRRAAGLQLFGEEAREADRLATFEKHLLTLSPAEQLVELYEKLVEPTLIDPCFVTRVPGVIMPLAQAVQGRRLLRRRLRACDQRPGDQPRLHGVERPRRAGRAFPPSGRRPRGTTAGRRGFPHRSEVRHAPRGRDRARHRSIGDAADRRGEHSGCDLVSADADARAVIRVWFPSPSGRCVYRRGLACRCGDDDAVRSIAFERRQRALVPQSVSRSLRDPDRKALLVHLVDRSFLASAPRRSRRRSSACCRSRKRFVLLLTAKYLVKRRLAWVSLIAVALCVGPGVDRAERDGRVAEHVPRVVPHDERRPDRLAEPDRLRQLPGDDRRRIEKLPDVRAAVPLIETIGPAEDPRGRPLAERT